MHKVPVKKYQPAVGDYSTPQTPWLDIRGRGRRLQRRTVKGVEEDGTDGREREWAIFTLYHI